MDLPLLAAETLTSHQFQRLLEHLRKIIDDLPSELPVGDPATSKYSAFLSFQLDDELVDRTGSDIGALNWETLKPNRNARVLSILATKIFAVLVNSMPDERTGSTLTWLNSPLRANQNARTLIDMIQIGQHYRTDSKKAVRKKCYRPVVKFRDMDKELLQVTVLGHESTTPGNGNSGTEYPTGDPENDGESENDVISQPEDSDTDMLLVPHDKDQRRDGVETNLLTDEDVSLDNGALRDLLAIEPVTSVASHSKPRTVAKTVVDMSTTETNWDF